MGDTLDLLKWLERGIGKGFSDDIYEGKEFSLMLDASINLARAISLIETGSSPYRET